MELIRIGQLKKTFGLQGELRLDIEEAFWDDLLEAEVLFVEIKGQMVPFFIEEIKEGTDVLIKFEEVGAKEEAAPLSNRSVYLRKTDLSEPVQDIRWTEEQLEALVGYSVWTQEVGLIGPIIEFVDMPMQLIAVVAYQGRELLIPFVRDFLIDIQEERQKIKMRLPEGLLEL